MKLNAEDFRVPEGKKITLETWPTLVEPAYESKGDYQKHLATQIAHLSALQQLLYATNRLAVLLIFQAMDAAGNVGVIKHLMSGVNPRGRLVLVLVLCLASGAAMDAAMGPHSGKGSGELGLVRGVLKAFCLGDVMLAHALYSTTSGSPR